MASIVATVIHGSHLFGTNTEGSDRDYKTVLLPEARDILLGRVDESWIEQTKTNLRIRNTSHDTDHEHHLLLRFIQLLAAADPMALEMLFAPDRFHVREAHPLWKSLQSNTDRFVTRQVSRFARYCRGQAEMYDSKVERLETAEGLQRFLVEIVREYGRQERLSRHIPAILRSFPNRECISTESRPLRGSRTGEILHLSMFGKLAAETVTVETALDMVEAKLKDYGERTRRTKEIGGRQWKNLAHSIRIGYEALELLTTGRIELPSRKSPHLLDVRRGIVPLEVVLGEIDFLLNEMPRVSVASGLPDEADLGFLEGIVADAHLEEVLASAASPSCQLA